MKKQYKAHFDPVALPSLQLETASLTLDHPNTVTQSYPGPKFSRQDLEVLSSGTISSKFGSWFAELDQYHRLIRMPEPPLLLADRVLGIDAEPGSCKKGTIWTQTDVLANSWYLHRNRMTPGIMIEAGQADLLLISWLGFDFHNRGERIYRLLGCEIVFLGELPKSGDQLQFDIHIDGHAKQGDIRLFFFYYDCYVNGELRMKVRHGQAGFFTDEELKNSGGVLWDANTAKYDANKVVEPPRLHCEFKSFDRDQIKKYAQGDVAGCFGKGFEYTQTHSCTPSIPDGRLLLIHAITDFDPCGGPWQRGYIRSVQKIDPDDWFFKGHFKNDPCMPGTLMLEAGLQTMMFYMTAIGYTLDKDGWRFEPVIHETYKLTCRGQVIPSACEVVYEVFVYGCQFSPVPTLYVDLLGTVDGSKSFHTKIGMRLIPDWPFDAKTHNSAHKDRAIAIENFRYDYASLLACALGKPSAAFGSMYDVFDTGRRVARLPGPPYHFISRITQINAEKNSLKSGGELIVELDIEPAGWYFDQNGSAVMPFCVLLEAGLQPCGWLASFLGCALTADEELFYRNLDGTGKLSRDITPNDKVLETRVKCLNISRIASMVIISFNVQCFVGEEQIYFMDTVFGYFPLAAFESQVGLPIPEYEQGFLNKPSNFRIDLTTRPSQYCGGNLRLADTKLLMIDEIEGYWPEEGSKKSGVLRAVKKVNPNEWFFKAHFFQYPVQPGSLGIEAMIQLVQFYMLHKNLHKNLKHPRFESLALGTLLTWKYRGQVVPNNQLIHILIDIVEEGYDQKQFPFVKVNASLWVDNKRIYEAKELGMRIVDVVKQAVISASP